MQRTQRRRAGGFDRNRENDRSVSRSIQRLIRSCHRRKNMFNRKPFLNFKRFRNYCGL
jgi:hypothetical protein